MELRGSFWERAREAKGRRICAAADMMKGFEVKDDRNRRDWKEGRVRERRKGKRRMREEAGVDKAPRTELISASSRENLQLPSIQLLLRSEARLNPTLDCFVGLEFGLIYL
jgi:hypothetical protein